MFGALLANTLPPVPSAQLRGMLASSTAYADQFGRGVATPWQVSCCSAEGSPVLSMALEMSWVPGVFWNTPTPPRITARGARIIPGSSAIWSACPTVHENPTRGLT